VVETTGGWATWLPIDERGEVRDRERFGPANREKSAWTDGPPSLFVLTLQGDMRDASVIFGGRDCTPFILEV